MAENPLAQKFKEWQECLEGTTPQVIDPNSVEGVIGTLYWEMGAYEGYEAICKADNNSPFATLLFGRLTAFNYIQVQALRVRRLCEPAATPKGDKDTSIYSLRRIVDEMKQARKAGEFTRANICDIYKIPPTPEEARRQFDEALAKGAESTSWVGAAQAGNAHNMLDQICDKNGLLKKHLLDELDKRLQVTKNAELSQIYYFVDKNIAHSASQSSRDQVAADLALRVADMKKVVHGITEACYCLTMLISRAGQGSLVAIGWDGQLGNLSQRDATIVHNAYKAIDDEFDALQAAGYGLLGITRTGSRRACQTSHNIYLATWRNGGEWM